MSWLWAVLGASFVFEVYFNNVASPESSFLISYFQFFSEIKEEINWEMNVIIDSLGY